MITISFAAQIGLLVAGVLLVILVWRTRVREAPRSGGPLSDQDDSK